VRPPVRARGSPADGLLERHNKLVAIWRRNEKKGGHVTEDIIYRCRERVMMSPRVVMALRVAPRAFAAVTCDRGTVPRWAPTFTVTHGRVLDFLQ
jgi:hypothetical protein